MDKNKYFNLKNKVIFFLSFCILLILVLVSVLPNSFASLVPVKSISFESEKLSYEKNEAGSYKITKSAEWIAKGKARITFQVDTKELKKENTKADTILIVDTSGSMAGEKLDKVKSDSIDLINKILENEESRVSIIEFNTNATLLSDFTNNVVELTDTINNLQARGGTNYYQALVKLDEILKNYQKENGREVLTLFLTDGYPGIDTPNEVGQYKYLKNEYPYITINAIQYEMGNTVLEAIKNISDNQFIADMDTLNNVLIEASAKTSLYDELKITDYINNEYFTVEEKEDIKTSIGKITLDKDKGKVTWNLDGLTSGKSATMTIDVYLKEEYIDKFDLYKTNTKEEVTSEIDDIKENISKTDTPILSTGFTVTYDENTPDGCKVEGNIPKSKQYSSFDPVQIEASDLVCDGYQFQGWEIVNKENVSMIGNNFFVSDGNNIKLKAIWSKVSLKKSIDGTVHNVEPIIKEIPNLNYNGEFWSDKYKQNTTKIIIQNELNPITEAVEFWDVSEANDGSVMAYALLNEDATTYTIYLQGPGKIIANENSNFLFAEFEKLESIEGLENLDTSNVTSMRAMFSDCTSLINLDISSFDTSKVVEMYSIFARCKSLTSLDLSHLDTSNVVTMGSMFWNCISLTNLDLNHFDTSNVTNMANMFYGCSNIINLDISHFDTSKVTNMVGMFSGCSNLVSLDLSNFDTSNVTHMVHMFKDCSGLTSLDLSNFDTSNAVFIGGMFTNCSSLSSLNVSSFDTSKVTSMVSLFKNCNSLTSLDISNFNTSNVVYMNEMFNGCGNLTDLDLSHFDTSQVTGMKQMFFGCRSLTNLDLSSFNTSNVTNTEGMFYDCRSLKNLDMRNASFDKVVDSNSMFDGMSNLSVIVKDEANRSWIQSRLGSNGTAIIAS